jgi:hypothetical protein
MPQSTSPPKLIDGEVFTGEVIEISHHEIFVKVTKIGERFIEAILDSIYVAENALNLFDKNAFEKIEVEDSLTGILYKHPKNGWRCKTVQNVEFKNFTDRQKEK